MSEKWEVALDYLGGDHRRVIVNMGDVGGSFEANMKRARLIAAAPALLEALEKAVEVLEFCYQHGVPPKEIAQARAALAAAKGDA